jgi:hypothetical protein
MLPRLTRSTRVKRGKVSRRRLLLGSSFVPGHGLEEGGDAGFEPGEFELPGTRLGGIDEPAGVLDVTGGAALEEGAGPFQLRVHKERSGIHPLLQRFGGREMVARFV